MILYLGERKNSGGEGVLNEVVNDKHKSIANLSFTMNACLNSSLDKK